MVFTCGAAVETSEGLGYEGPPEEIQSSDDGTQVFTYRPQFMVLADHDPFPYFSVRRYAELALQFTSTETMEDDRFFVESAEFPGVWGDGDTAEQARSEFVGAVYEWAMVKIEKGHHDLPIISSINLNLI